VSPCCQSEQETAEKAKKNQITSKQKTKIQQTEAHSLPSSPKKSYPLLSVSYLKQKNIIPFSSNVTFCHSDSEYDSSADHTAASLPLTRTRATHREGHHPQVPLIQTINDYMPPTACTWGTCSSLVGVNNYTGTRVRHHQWRWLLYLQWAVQPVPDWASRGDERNQAKISRIQLFKKSSPTDIKRIAFSSSHKHLLLLVTSFLIK